MAEAGLKRSRVSSDLQAAEPAAKHSRPTSNTWTKLFSDKHNKNYWFNESTGQTSWHEPELEHTPSSEHTDVGEWIEKMSTKYDAKYWFNSKTGQSVWEDPTGRKDIARAAPGPTIPAAAASFDALLAAERMNGAVDAPGFPWLINSVNIPQLIRRLQMENATKIEYSDPSAEFKAVFELKDEDTSHVNRAIQEAQMMKTRLKLRTDSGVKDVPSFWEVWNSNPELSRRIKAATDPHEEKWKCMRPFGYKLATNFMPGYAKGLYEYFQAATVLDPCSGWGDRMLGAAVSRVVKKYVGFDPNKYLRPGYVDTMAACGFELSYMTDDRLKFSNGFEIRSQPFEKGALELEDNCFDCVFTSPPFFDYEMYSVDNPEYVDWLTDFYEPLFIHACRCVKPGGYVGIYIGDTSAGAITPFILNRVHLICPLKIVQGVGFLGIMSNKVRGVWVFQKAVTPIRPAQFPLYERNLKSNLISIAPASIDMNFRVNQWAAQMTNPKLSWRNLRHPHRPEEVLTLMDDGNCVGGTKQRLLGALLQTVRQREVIYAGPGSGYAQVALGYAAKLYGKKGTLFLNGSPADLKSPLCRMALTFGLDIKVGSDYCTLQDAEAKATAYAKEDPENRLVLPFGLRTDRGQHTFNVFHTALSESLTDFPRPPIRLWLVAGSGFILDVLHSIWPTTKYMVVQVGKKVWKEVLEGKDYELFVAPERFGDTGLQQPPYRTVPWYDAKLWQFVVQYGRSGDCIWNVAAVPDSPEEAVQSVLSAIESSRPR